jgi:hypothetical protein
LPAALAAANIADTAAIETVFADAAGTLNSAGAADATYNGQHSANDTYTVSAAALTVSKTVASLWDPVNAGTNPKAIPGAYVQYSIVVTNGGATSASLTTLSDTLVTTLLDPDLIDGAGVAESGAGDGIKVVVTGSGRAVTSIFCTGDTAADTDTDGCSYPGDAPIINSVVGINLGTLLVAEDVLPAGAGAEDYAIGELKAGETVTITFNAIVQ